MARMTRDLGVHLWNRADMVTAFKKRARLLLDVAERLEAIQNMLREPLADNVPIVLLTLEGSEVVRPAVAWLRKMGAFTEQQEADFGTLLLPPGAHASAATDVMGARYLYETFLKHWPNQRRRLPAFLRECCRVAGYEWPMRDNTKRAVTNKAKDVIKAIEARYPADAVREK